jgi:ceramide glucosyltransferase
VIAASVLLYLVMVMGFLAAMLRRPVKIAPSGRPRVSILKPLAGTDDELAENLASFVELDYPDYELLLGVASVNDLAYPVARRFVEMHGERARLIVTDPAEAVNPKVAQLLALERAATGTIVVVSDSNVRVAPDYVEGLVGELSRPGVGVVSSIFAGTGEQTLGAALENLQLGALVAPGVVSSRFWTGRTITVGKSMAMWRDALRSVGGFERVGDLLSEDHMLGKRFAEAGYELGISLEAVENRNVTCTLGRMMDRHARWAKLRRALHPVGFAFEPMLYPVVVCTFACAAAPSKLLCVAFLASLLLQITGTFVMTKVLRGNLPRWFYLPLEVVRSYLLFVCWLRACSSTRVGWRGHDFELTKDTRIVPAEPSVWTRVRAMVRA